MIACQNAFYDMDTQFVASMDDDFTDALAHCAMQNLVPVLRSPHDMVSMIKSRVRGRRVSDFAAVDKPENLAITISYEYDLCSPNELLSPPQLSAAHNRC